VAIAHILGQEASAPRDQTVADLRVLVSRLARSLRLAEPGNALSEDASECLKRTGLVGSALREGAKLTDILDLPDWSCHARFPQ
jgi:hypothetical protein